MNVSTIPRMRVRGRFSVRRAMFLCVCRPMTFVLPRYARDRGCIGLGSCISSRCKVRLMALIDGTTDGSRSRLVTRSSKTMTVNDCFGCVLQSVMGPAWYVVLHLQHKSEIWPTDSAFSVPRTVVAFLHEDGTWYSAGVLLYFIRSYGWRAGFLTEVL